MIDCVDFAHMQSHFFDVGSVKELFDPVNPSTIIVWLLDYQM